MKKLFFIAVLMGIFVISSVSAETISYDFSYLGEGLTRMSVLDGNANADIRYLYISDIAQFAGLKSVIHGFETYYPTTISTLNYADCPVTFKIGGNIVGSGTYAWNKLKNSAGTVTGFTFLVVTDDWDVSAYSGSQFVEMVLDDPDLYMHSTVRAKTYTGDPNGMAGCRLALTTAGYWQFGKTKTYHEIDFHQTLEYAVNGGAIDFVFNRNNFANQVKIINSAGLTLYDAINSENLNQQFYENNWLNISVYNPFYPSEPPWFNQIPETTGPSLLDPAEFTAYVYDAQTGNLISWSWLNKTYSGEYALPSTTHDPDGVIQDVVYWDETDWAHFTASATGYLPDTTGFNYTAETAPGGTTTQMTFHLVPDGSLGNNSYALSFMINQEISPSSEIFTRAIDATVTCDGEQHLTGPTGTTWFNVTSGEHTYTVAKNGFETVQGTTTISGNMLQTVYLHLSPDVPTTDNTTGGGDGDEQDPIHQGIEDTYADLGKIIPGGVMLVCLLFLMKVIKKA